MDAIEQEARTSATSNYIDSFFSKLPVDGRFNKVTYQKFIPTSGLTKDSTNIIFILEPLDLPMCYLIGDAFLEANVTIVDAKTGDLPAKTAQVGPCCNMIHSLFSSVKMTLNHQTVSLDQGHYQYKSYIQDLLSFATDVKTSTLQTQGFHIDRAGHMGTAVLTTGAPENTGWASRISYFRKNQVADNDYRPEGAVFIGKLRHELSSVNKPIPHGIRIGFEFVLSSHQFYLMKTATDTNNYKFIINQLNLFCPVAWLSQPMLMELESR